MDIALQLFSIREEAQANFAQALEMAEKAGYQGVEFAGYFGTPSEGMRSLLKQHRLKAVSSHVGLKRLQEGLEEELEYAKQVGYKLIVCPRINCETKDRTIEDAKILEACAQKAASQGITLGYHNHAHEFTTQFDGRYALELLLETAPTVKFQPDVYWISVGGVDPVKYLVPWVKAGRVCAVHAKELAQNGKDNGYIGQGIIDFPALMQLCPPGVYPWIVEQEKYSTDHAEGIAQSYQGLRKIFER